MENQNPQAQTKIKINYEISVLLRHNTHFDDFLGYSIPESSEPTKVSREKVIMRVFHPKYREFISKLEGFRTKFEEILSKENNNYSALSRIQKFRQRIEDKQTGVTVLVLDYAPPLKPNSVHESSTITDITIFAKQGYETLQLLADYNIVHRDICPENLYFFNHKLLFLNWMNWVLWDESTTSFHAGRPGFRSPEVLFTLMIENYHLEFNQDQTEEYNKTHKLITKMPIINSKVDVWAFGIVLLLKILGKDSIMDNSHDLSPENELKAIMQIIGGKTLKKYVGKCIMKRETEWPPQFMFIMTGETVKGTLLKAAKEINRPIGDQIALMLKLEIPDDEREVEMSKKIGKTV